MIAERLETIRDHLLLKSPTVRFCAEHGMLGLARLNRGLGLRRNGQNVAMFHLGRSGSQVLATQLAQHPEIFWDNELFWRSRLRAYRALGESRFKPLEIALLAPYKTRKPWYGFEMKLTDFPAMGLDPAPFVDALARNAFGRCITLRRRNVLRQYISAKIMGQTRRTHYRVNEKTTPQRLAVAVDDFIEIAARVAVHWATMRQCLQNQQVLELTYEEHIEQDPAVAYRKVCAFLGLEAAPAAIRLRRGNPLPVRELVTNFAELEQALGTSDYAWMLDG